jgi:hypothetical protein
MEIPQVIIEPFGYTGMPTLNAELKIYQQLVVIDWELKMWWDQHAIMLDTLLKKCLRDVAKIHGARVVHVYTTKRCLMVHYKVNNKWGTTRLRT